jgi:preprotein translocase subunit SecF
MLRIFHNPHYNFIRWWRWAAGLTIAFIAIGLATYAASPPNYSIEFTGGTLMQLRFQQAPNVAEIRSALDHAGVRGAEIQQFGTGTEYTVRAQGAANVAEQAAGAGAVSTRIQSALRGKYGNGFTVVRTEAVGPRVGEELKRGAMIALLLGSLATLAYLAFRFEWRFGVAAVLSSVHDVLVTAAFIKLFHIEVSLTVVAAILTLLGYSMNDTIIIFDRVRENLKKQRREPLYDTLNRSINETLPRSVLTHATTFAAALALVVFAGEVIRPFAIVMAFGVVVGVFSSVYVASPLLLWVEQKWPRRTTDKAGISASRARAASTADPRPARPATARREEAPVSR